MSKETKKVRRIEMEKVKSGKGGHLHKVTVHYHDKPPKEGKGMAGAIGRYEPPEETYHTSHASAKRHVHKAMQHMTATPDEPIEQGEDKMGGLTTEPESVNEDVMGGNEE